MCLSQSKRGNISNFNTPTPYSVDELFQNTALANIGTLLWQQACRCSGLFKCNDTCTSIAPVITTCHQLWNSLIVIDWMLSIEPMTIRLFHRRPCFGFNAQEDYLASPSPCLIVLRRICGRRAYTILWDPQRRNPKPPICPATKGHGHCA